MAPLYRYCSVNCDAIAGDLHATPTFRLIRLRCAHAQVDQSYSQPEECLLGGDGDLGGAYIVRLPCGDSNDYLRCVQRQLATWLIFFC